LKLKTSNTDSIQAPDEQKIHYNKLPWTKLTFRKRELKPLKENKEKPIIALDTETLSGYAKLLCDSTGKKVLDGDIYSLLSFLTAQRFRGSINFFFNLQYDFDAIMKYLPEENLKELVYDNKTKFGPYDISHIPKKMFNIKLNGNSYRYYDLAQFFEMSLENAGKKYVAEVKNEDNLDRALIGSSPDYWDKYQDLIIKYCFQDCNITQKLGVVLQKEIQRSAGFTPKDYISKAGLAKRYFRSQCDIPDTRDIPLFAKFFAYQSYHGGRFEVTERGKVGYCSALDINSAYPYQIANLIDVTKGTWKRVTEISESAYYGFYLATVTIPYMYLPPLALNWMNTVIFPCGTWTAYFSLEELRVVGEIGSYEIINGAEFYPEQIKYPFKDAIELLYHKKSITPKNSYEYALYKKIMNSFYGSMYEKIKQPDGRYKVGLLFNPIYASLITANTRLQLWRKACEYGDRCVSLATDGILIRGDIEAEDTKELGAWGVDTPGEAYILRSGIYSVGDSFKQRGVVKGNYFHTPVGDYDNLFQYIADFPDWKKYPVLNKRPYHMSECIRHTKTKTVDMINVFAENEIAFDLNSDVKRVFDMVDITGSDLLKNRITSKPHLIGF